MVQHEIRQLLQAGIIEKSGSPWAAPVMLVPKKDGTLHLCVDYRHLNMETIPDPHIVLRIDELLDGLEQQCIERCLTIKSDNGKYLSDQKVFKKNLLLQRWGYINLEPCYLG